MNTTPAALKPPVPYFGSKNRLAPWIASLLPDHDHYVEPYCGGLSVLLAKQPSRLETVNDLDGELMCVTPSTRILTADYRWVHAGDVHVGDRLVAFDEHNAREMQPGRRVPTSYRRWRGTEVQAVRTVRKPCYRLVFDDGTEVTASADHMWMCSGPAGRSRGMRWLRTENLICNRATQRSWVVKLLDVVERERSWEAGWLAGFFDGEGNILSSGTNASGWRVSVSQKLGPEADLCERLLKERGFEVRQHMRNGSDRWQPIASLVLGGGKSEVLRFLSLIGPQRLIRNFNAKFLENSSLHGHRPVGLVAKEFVGEQDVMAIQTSSRTYIAEGLASHNCFWRVLRDRPADLIRACALTPHSRAEQDAAYEPATDELETARSVWVRLTQGRGGTLRKTGWRQYIDPAGTATSMPGCLDGYVDRLAAAAERLHAVSLEALPALDVIAKYGKHPRVLLYVDPPYLGSTRSFANYRHEMRSDDQHRELAAALADCRAAVVLSGYGSPLYDELYDGWHRHETSARADNSTSDRTRTEVLWANRPLGDRLDLFADPAA